MKYVLKTIPFVMMFSLLLSCNQNKQENTNEAAEEANEEKFEDRNEEDAEFVAEAVAGNYAEVQLAQLASQKSNDAEVKNIAQMLESEHSKALQELQNMAQAKNISLPAEPTEEQKRTVENLREEEEIDEFNREWCNALVDKHQKTIDMYEDNMERTEDAELKSWINSTLPALRTHLEQLKACQDKLKSS